VTGYVLEAGSEQGLANLATLPVGTATSFVSPPVPDGSYFVRLRALNAAGPGPRSADVRAVVGPPPPGAPVLSGSAAAGTVSLSWTAPTTGVPPSGYRLMAGTEPGASNAAVLLLPATETTFMAGGVPPGTYYVRIAATSSQGPGDPSNELMLVVP
jgi:titin